VGSHVGVNVNDLDNGGVKVHVAVNDYVNVNVNVNVNVDVDDEVNVSVKDLATGSCGAALSTRRSRLATVEFRRCSVPPVAGARASPRVPRTGPSSPPR